VASGALIILLRRRLCSNKQGFTGESIVELTGAVQVVD